MIPLAQLTSSPIILAIIHQVRLKQFPPSMEAPIGAAYVVVLLLTVVLTVLFSTHFRRRKLNLPPGPKPWPIIGNFNLIGPLPHRSLHELSKTYGPIMMVWFGSVPVLVGSSVEMARVFLRAHDVAFAGRPKSAAGKYTTYNYLDMAWADYGPYWLQARKICAMELFSSKRLESFEYIRVEELNLLIRGIFDASLSGKPMVLKNHLSNFTLDVISRMVVGKKYLDEKQGSTWTRVEFRKMLDELFLLNGVLNLGDWIPCLKLFDVQGYVKRMKAVAKKFDKFMEHVLDEHESRSDQENENWMPKDMVDVLLQLVDHRSLEIKLERDGVKGLTQDLIAGGTESAALVVEWAISELLRHPKVITKATEELDRVIGTERWVIEKDMQNLPYIRAILKETMRLRPVVPLLSPRMSREDVQIQGYDIPKGSLVFVNTFTSQRDPNVYEMPEEFWPERFIRKNTDVKGQDFELLPFGSGRRICPAYGLAMKVVDLSFTNLLHGFIWKLPDNMKAEDLSMEEVFGLSCPRKIPLVVCTEPRLAPHLYHVV